MALKILLAEDEEALSRVYKAMRWIRPLTVKRQLT
mgnify:CR=1 FL=1